MHGQRYLPGQRLQADALARRAARATWSGARRPAAGPSPRATSFIAPWLTRRRRAPARRPLRPGAAAGDPGRRARQRAVHGPHRVPGDRQARRRSSRCRRCAGWWPPARRSTPRCCAPSRRPPASRSATATARPRPASSPACPPAAPVRPGSMGRPLPGVGLEVDDGELVLADPRTDPDLLRGLPGRRAARPRIGRGAPAIASPPTRTATCTSRAAPTT